MKRFQIGLALSPIVFVLLIAIFTLSGCVTPAVIGGAMVTGGVIAQDYGDKLQRAGRELTK